VEVLEEGSLTVAYISTIELRSHRRQQSAFSTIGLRSCYRPAVYAFLLLGSAATVDHSLYFLLLDYAAASIIVYVFYYLTYGSCCRPQSIFSTIGLHSCVDHSLRFLLLGYAACIPQSTLFTIGYATAVVHSPAFLTIWLRSHCGHSLHPLLLTTQ